MRAGDVTETLTLALEVSGCDQAEGVHKPRLLSDNGSSYIAGDLADWLEEQGMDHVRGAHVRFGGRAGETHRCKPTGRFGSTLHLAVHLLNDGWLDAYDCAVVVSNDSDIAEAMRLVRQHQGKRIGLVTPGTGRPSRQLMAHADFARHVRPNTLRRSQLPDPIPGTNIRKPARW